jgi:hypothetical protein
MAMAVDRNKPKGRASGLGAKKGGDVFDASPSGTTDISAGGNGKRPHNIQDTEGWKKGSSGVKKIWNNYINFLKASFTRMSRDDQENYITKFSQVITIGLGVVALQLFYPMLPSLLRVISLPLIVGVAWYLGNKVIAPTMIDRMGKYLNDYDDY